MLGLFVLAKTAKFWIVVAFVVSLLGGLAWFVNDYRETLKELAVSEKQVSNLEIQLLTVSDKIQKEQDKTQSLRSNNSKITAQYLSTVRELQALKNNYEMLKANPDEAAEKIQASFNVFMNDVSCITGESSQCPE